MCNKIYISLLFLILSSSMYAQKDSSALRIVDTLTVQERENRNPIILKSELDSLIKLSSIILPQQAALKPEPMEADSGRQYILPGLITILLLLVLVIYLLTYQQNKIRRALTVLIERAKKQGVQADNQSQLLAKDKKGKLTHQALESRIEDLNVELLKLSKENEGLNRVVKEYNGIQHEYDTLRYGIQKAYKIKKYPGYDNAKGELAAIKAVFDTEDAVVAFAYEKFLKPILAIADSNKNNPAKLSEEDNEKLLDLVVSLSLLYIEYLYLRVGDLAIGGRIVERINGFTKGKLPDVSLLKKMNTEFGSRALVVKIALNKAELHHLSYPVFDETNLNNQ